MKHYLSGITFLVIISSACQQKQNCSYINDYYQLVYLAEEAFYKKDYKAAYNLLTEADNNCKLLNQKLIGEMMIFAQCAARVGDKDKALLLVRELILKGYDIQKLSNNEAFENLLNTEEWKLLEENYNHFRNEYLNSVDVDLRKQLAEMTYYDQYYRKMLNNTSNEDSVWRLIKNTDSINDVKLKEIINAYGYPNESIVGNVFWDGENIDPGVLLFHFDDYKYYTETLLPLIDEGNAPPNSYGNFVDSYQRRVDSTKKFIYGIYDNATSEQIFEYEKLDERRVAVGLQPLALKKSIDSLKRIYYKFD